MGGRTNELNRTCIIRTMRIDCEKIDRNMENQTSERVSYFESIREKLATSAGVVLVGDFGQRRSGRGESENKPARF